MKKLLLPIFFTITYFAQAQVILHVDADASVSGDGTSWSQAFQYLDEAFSAAAEGDQIWVAEGTYTPGGATPSRTTWINPTGNFELYGGFEGNETALTERNPQIYRVIINGDVLGDDTDDLQINVSDNLMHLMVLDTFITNATLIDGVTFTRGITDNASGSGNDRRGGGILSFGSPILENCRFIENYGWFGGGAYPRGEDAVNFKVRNSLFTNNGGGTGGAMYVVGGQTLEIVNCLFEENSVENTGGALRIQDTDNYNIRDCSFESNRSSSSGGAIYLLRGNGNISTSEFLSNLGNFGGAFVNYTNGVVNIDSCLFDGNISLASGAAMSLAFESTTNITACSFLENRSSATSGAIYIQGGETPGDTTTNVAITDCFFELNEASSSAGAVWARHSAQVAIDRTTFIDNVSTNSAGAILIGPDSLDLGATVVRNSFFYFNASGTQGGGIDVQSADLTLTNSVLNGNEAETYGGGLMVNGADTTTSSTLVVNCTFSENEARIGGNEIGAFADGTDSTTLQIQNSIFNSEGVVYSTEAGSPNVMSLGGNVVSTGDIDSIFTQPTDLMVVDPDLIFVDTRDDLSLAVGSPAINVGISNANTPALDILGFTRDVMPDAGAYEFDISVNVNEVTSGIAAYEVSPNPAKEAVNVNFDLENQSLIGSSATMVLYDVKGKLLFEQSIRLASVQNTFSLNTSSLATGTYILQMVTELGVSSATLVKM